MLLIIKIMTDDCDFLAEFFFNPVYHRALAAARAARNADNNYIVHHKLRLLSAIRIFHFRKGLSFKLILLR